MIELGLVLGDGIGPEIVPSAVRVLETAIAEADAEPLRWVELATGRRALAESGTTLPEETRQALADLPGWVMGPHDSSSYPEPWRSRLSPHGFLRQDLELFANIRPVRCMPGVPSVVDDMDLVFVRENTEGFYSDRAMHAGTGEFMPTPDIALSIGVFTRRRAEQIARTACELAAIRRGRVTVVHKAHVLGRTMGLYLDVAREVAGAYPEIELDEVHVDASTVHLVRNPGRFDVLITENMHGDILSDLAAELAGALGMAPSLNAGEHQAMAQAAHGSAPDIAGQGIANPVGMILSGAMLLQWLSSQGHGAALAAAADLVRDAVEGALADGRGTRDLGRDDATTSFTDAIVARIG